MIEKYIKTYVDKLTIQDIIDFSKINSINLTDDEVSYIYNYVKNNWYEICFKDSNITLDKIKNNLSSNTYDIASNLYLAYKEKYKKYLE